MTKVIIDSVNELILHQPQKIQASQNYWPSVAGTTVKESAGRGYILVTETRKFAETLE
jgi:hypothetical protein